MDIELYRCYSSICLHKRLGFMGIPTNDSWIPTVPTSLWHRIQWYIIAETISSTTYFRLTLQSRDEDLEDDHTQNPGYLLHNYIHYPAVISHFFGSLWTNQHNAMSQGFLNVPQIRFVVDSSASWFEAASDAKCMKFITPWKVRQFRWCLFHIQSDPCMVYTSI